MADLNAMIAQGGVPLQIRSPLEQESRLMAFQNAQQQQQLNALKMQEYQRGVTSQNALRRSLQESYNPETGEYDLTKARTLAGQYGADPVAMQQFASGQETAAVQRENIAAQQAQREAETAARRTRALGQALSTVMDDASDDRLNAAFSMLDATGVNTAPLRQQFAAMPLEQRRRVIQNYAAGSEEGRKALEFVAPKLERVELGDRVDVVDMNPNSPTYQKVLQSLPKGATPRQSQLLTPEEEQQKARIAAAGRAPVQPPAPTLTTIQNPANPAEMIVVDARTGRAIGSAGKAAPVAAAEAKREEGASQARSILDTLRTAYDELDRRRAVPSEARNAVSNTLSYIASTGVGQVAGRMAGTGEQTQRDIIQSSRNQLLNAVKNATGMSAQQLNSNVEFRSWLEALTDPTRSIESNRAVLDNLERFIASEGSYTTRGVSGKISRPAPAQPGAAAPAAGGWSVVK